jgi:hypothetical protein
VPQIDFRELALSEVKLLMRPAAAFPVHSAVGADQEIAASGDEIGHGRHCCLLTDMSYITRMRYAVNT